MTIYFKRKLDFSQNRIYLISESEDMSNSETIICFDKSKLLEKIQQTKPSATELQELSAI